MPKDFVQMWSEADEADAAIGGMDTIPEREREDYGLSMVIALTDDFRHGREVRKRCSAQEGK